MPSLALASLVVNGLLLAAAAEPPGYWSQPQGDYAGRARAFLEFSASSNSGGLYSQVSKLALDKGPLDRPPSTRRWRPSPPARMGRTSSPTRLVRIYRSPSKLVTPELRQEIKTALLGLKYWVDEPGGKDLHVGVEREPPDQLSRRPVAGGRAVPRRDLQQQRQARSLARRRRPPPGAEVDRHQGEDRLHRVGFQQLLHQHQRRADEPGRAGQGSARWPSGRR